MVDQKDLFGQCEKSPPGPKGVSLAGRRYCDLSDEELALALHLELPGAMSEESLRATLAAYPTVRRENCIPSFGEAICRAPY